MASPTSKPVEFKPWKKPSVEGTPPSARCVLHFPVAVVRLKQPPCLLAFSRQGHASAVVGDKTYLFGGSCVIDETTVYLADLFCLSST